MRVSALFLKKSVELSGCYLTLIFERAPTRAWEYRAIQWQDCVPKSEGGCRYIEWRTKDGEDVVTGIEGSVGK
jgi:hypothetical protein